jgi:hypothetical protein
MCPGCREAESNPMTHVLYLDCRSCEARALAVSRIYEQSAAAGAMTKEYRKSLGQVFGERWKEGHEMVKKWAGRMKAGACASRS